MKTVKDCIIGFKYYFIITLILITVGVILETSIPFLAAELIDHERPAAEIVRIGGVIAGIITGALIAGVLSGCNTARISVRLAQLLRERVYERIQELSFQELDSFSNISIVTRLTTDITNLQNAVQISVNVLLRSLVIIICTVAVTIVIAPLIGGIFLVILVPAIIVVLVISQKAVPYFGEGLAVYDRLNQSIQDNVTAARVIKAFAREEQETEKFKTGSELMYELFVKAEQMMLPAVPLMTFAINTGLILMIGIGSRKVLFNTLPTGDFIVLFTYTANLLAALLALMGGLFSVLSGAPSLQRVAQLLDAGITAEKSGGAVCLPDGRVEFKNVSFRYLKDTDKYDLRNINIAVGSGETLGIIGGIGSGKSTFAQLIAGLYFPDAGQVLAGGIPVSEYRGHVLKENIGMVMQKSLLFSGTVAENLRWGNERAEDEELWRALDIADAAGFVKALDSGIGTRVEQGGTNFSGGQRQRLCIARALLKDPRILILDDATSAVDAETDQKIRSAIRRELPDTTIIMISQRVAVIRDCDRILVLDEGQLKGCGTHEALLQTNQIYQEIFMSQQGGGDFDVQ